MTESKPYLPWPGTDERSVVEEMIRDRHSKHWEECSEFVKRCVYAKVKSVPGYLHQEDITQEILYKIAKYLPHFRFQCALKVWLYPIIEHCIIDTYRKPRNEGQFNALLGDPPNKRDREGEELTASEAQSAEDVFLTNDDLRNGMMALLEYASTHSNPIRNRLIIRMILFEGQTHAEAAKAACCHAPVVGYVVREAQRYAREKRGHRL